MFIHKLDIKRGVKIPENKELKFEEKELLKKIKRLLRVKSFYRDLSKLISEEKMKISRKWHFVHSSFFLS